MSIVGHCQSKQSNLNKLLGFKKALQMVHLPESHYEQNDSLSNRPPQNALVRAVTSLSKSLLSCLQIKAKCSIKNIRKKQNL